MSSAPGFRPLSLAGAALLLTLAACGPDPTPLPVLPVATTPAPEATQAADALPVVTVDRLTLRLLPDEARVRLDAVAAVTTVESVADGAAGPAVSVQPFEGGTLTGYGLNVAAMLNTTTQPLNDPSVAAALIGFLTNRPADPLRLALANAGFPDGVTLTVAADPRVFPLVITGLDSGPIRWELAPAGTTASVTVAAGAEADTMIGQGGLLVGALPLYGRGWQVGRGDDGLPLFTPGS